jgi:energy-coupling factor transport system ATP-binding protein
MDKSHRKAVEVANVSFSYDGQKTILKDISFSIDEGEYVCIVGHNGSGKSTFSKLLMALYYPNEGSISVFGTILDFKSEKQLRNKIGIIFQNPDNQFIGMTAADDIAFGLETRKYSRKKMDAIIRNISKKMKIESLLEKDPVNLSGGQKQKVAIAGVLAINPEIIIFDESTSMLDPKGKQEIKQTILNLKKENPKKTIISITHDMEEVIKADKVIVFYEGKIAKIAKPQEIFNDYEFVRKMKLNFPFLLSLSSELGFSSINEEEILERLTFVNEK